MGNLGAGKISYLVSRLTLLEIIRASRLTIHGVVEWWIAGMGN
jgi:hypothetical protein